MGLIQHITPQVDNIPLSYVLLTEIFVDNKDEDILMLVLTCVHCPWEPVLPSTFVTYNRNC